MGPASQDFVGISGFSQLKWVWRRLVCVRVVLGACVMLNGVKGDSGTRKAEGATESGGFRLFAG